MAKAGKAKATAGDESPAANQYVPDDQWQEIQAALAPLDRLARTMEAKWAQAG